MDDGNYSEGGPLTDRPDALLRLALARQEERDTDGALAALERALALEPDCAEAYGLLAELRLEQQRPVDALAAVEQAIALGPGLAALHAGRGRVLHHLGRLGEARDAFDRAISLAPNVAAIRFNAGVTLRVLGELDAARRELERAVELAPNLARAHCQLGVVLEGQRESQTAVRAYQRAIRLAPTEPEAHRRLGQLLFGVERLDEAQVCFENVLRIAPEDAEGLEGLADVYREKGLFEKAIPLYRHLAARGSVASAHFLAALTGQPTAGAPRDYVRELFDGYSEEFEEHLTGALGYRTPDALFDLFTRALFGDIRLERGLDLGCGTGLAGLRFRGLVSRLEGVDLSADMLEHARRKGVYAELHEADVVEFLEQTDDCYDLFVACDVLIYVGDLEALFGAVRRRSGSGAFFSFSVELCGSGDYELRASGRYAHSPAYVERLARSQGFEVVAKSVEALRKENGEWVEGALFVLRALQGT